MTPIKELRIAILYAGDGEARKNANTISGRFVKVFEAFQSLGAQAEPIVYHDNFCDEVKQQISKMHAVLVWVNPIEDGRDRSKLDSMLREVAAGGVYVSTNPDLILKLGTKEVLFRTKEIGWGCDTHIYSSLEQMRFELPDRLAKGETRVLKQFRGHSGIGVWRIESVSNSNPITEKSLVRARHAKSGCFEEIITLEEFYKHCAPYFTALNGEGKMIDQIYQERLPEGMVRCYLVQGKVEGFGRQEIVALHPAPEGAPPEAALQPTKRHYHPATMPEFQRLKQLLEKDWLPATQRILEINSNDLPALWDCDFFFGPKNALHEDTYVLCEINVSCVSPFPDSAAEPLARAVIARFIK